MNLNKAQKNALQTLSRGMVESLRDAWIRQDTIRSLVQMGLMQWKNFAGMRGGYVLTSEGKKAVEGLRR